MGGSPLAPPLGPGRQPVQEPARPFWEVPEEEGNGGAEVRRDDRLPGPGPPGQFAPHLRRVGHRLRRDAEGRAVPGGLCHARTR